MRFILCIIFLFAINAISFSQTKTFKVGFLLDKSSVETDLLLDHLEEEITDVVGEDAIIEFSKEYRLVNNNNEQLALENYKLITNKVDIIIAFGNFNNEVLTEINTYEKPTILFGVVSDKLLERSQFSSPKKIKNFTSIVTILSYQEDLHILNELVAPKRIGVLIEQEFLNSEIVDQVFTDIEKELEVDLEFITYKNLEDIINNVDGFDAVYLVGGFYFTENEIKRLAEVLIDKKIASFTSTHARDVEFGLLATNNDQSSYEQFYRRVALSVESIVVGEEFEEVSTLLELNKSLTLNINTANRIGIPLKYSLVPSTNFVGDFSLTYVDKKYSLVDVMKESIEENLILKTFKQDVLISDEDVKYAKSNYLPDVFGSVSGNYVDPEMAAASNGQNPELTTSGNISLSQTIFSESANANISIQKALYEAQKENYNSEELNTVFNATTAYFNALILKANFLIQNKNLDLTKRNLQIAEQNFEAGQTGKSDVLRFRSELVQNVQQDIEAYNLLQQGYLQLNEILNNPISTKIDVNDTELNEGVFKNYNYHQFSEFLDSPKLREPFIAFLVQEGLANSPELKSLDFNLKATERSEKLYGTGRFLPTLALQGQYNYTFSRSGEGSTFPPIFTTPPDGFYNVGVSLSLPIFNQNKQNINQQIATIQKEQIQTTTESYKLTIERNINDAVLQLINQISNIELSKVFEETAREVLDLTQTSYANGAVNIVQLLDAQNNYLQAQLESSTATYNYLLSSLQLERYLGNFFLLETEEEKQAFIARFLEFENNLTDN
ncbi:TolC family protein [Formosa maritima]|uniref:TolC family protein n=1 Tax=Formosa maritima TaxID=2592046 RepID=A0A5D0GAV1_9FLAO|nr:TolC family protein [Formosa maritima]TYA56004.1 TolC family protein [Formosa maritima]